eukprot:6212111-Pleurochrysis_carterae.AAC.5
MPHASRVSADQNEEQELVGLVHVSISAHVCFLWPWLKARCHRRAGDGLRAASAAETAQGARMQSAESHVARRA